MFSVASPNFFSAVYWLGAIAMVNPNPNTKISGVVAIDHSEYLLPIHTKGKVGLKL